MCRNALTFPEPSTRVRPRHSSNPKAGSNHDPSPIDDLPAIVDNLERNLVVFTDGVPAWTAENIENKIFECSDQLDTHSMLYICAVDQLHRRVKHRNPSFPRPEHLPSSTIVNAMRKRLAGTLRTGKRRCNHCRGHTTQKDKYRRRTHWLGCWARDVPGRCAACVAAQRRGCSFEENGPPEDDDASADEAEDDDESYMVATPVVPEAEAQLPPAQLRKADLETIVTLWYPLYEGFKDALVTKDSMVYKRLLEASERLNTYMAKLSAPPTAGAGVPTPYERMIATKWNHLYRGLDDVFRLFNAEYTSHVQQRLTDMHQHIVELALRSAEFARLYAESVPASGGAAPQLEQEFVVPPLEGKSSTRSARASRSKRKDTDKDAEGELDDELAHVNVVGV